MSKLRLITKGEEIRIWLKDKEITDKIGIISIKAVIRSPHTKQVFMSCDLDNLDDEFDIRELIMSKPKTLRGLMKLKKIKKEIDKMIIESSNIKNNNHENIK